MDYKRLKKQVKLLRNRLDDEALKKGVDITLDEYETYQDIAVDEFLIKEVGITLEEFNKLGKKKKIPVKYSEILDTPKIPTLEEIEGIAKKFIQPPVHKTEVKVIKERILQEPRIIRTEIQTKEIVKELDTHATDELRADFFHLQNSFVDQSKSLHELNELISEYKGMPEQLKQITEEMAWNFKRMKLHTMAGGEWGTGGAVSDQRYYTKGQVDALIAAGGGGTIDGSGTANELAYWVDSDTLGALAVATYPSLTELSYIKGVTSALQTQLNGKANTALSNLASVAINAALLPGTSDSIALGSATKQWSDLFLGTDGIINFNGGSAMITHAAASLSIAGGSTAANAINITGGGGIEGGAINISGGDADVGESGAPGGNIILAAGTPGFGGTKGMILLQDGASTMYAILDTAALATSNKTFTFPNLSGILALRENNLSVFAATTSAQLASVISDETGSGLLVFGTNPTLTNPTFAADGGALATTLINGIVEGRLTLTTALPITTADVTGAGTIYFTPYKGNRLAVYNGTVWKLYSFSELSLALTATSGSNYDVFVYDNAGTLTLETTVWTNDTTRATAVVLQDGVYVKSGATTRRYLGTFRASGTNTTEDSAAKRFVWNMYNRTKRFMKATESTNTWAYSSATLRETNNGSTPGVSRVDYVVGLSEDLVEAHAFGLAATNSDPNAFVAGVGIDSSTVNSAQIFFGVMQVVNLTGPTNGFYSGYPGIGYHSIRWLESSFSSGTTTWAGDLGAPTAIQSGLKVNIFA